MTPTQRSLKYLRDQGFLCGVVEKWNMHARIRQDLFNIIDIIAIKPGIILGVQATSDNGGNVAAHYNKALEQPGLKAWLDAGGQFQIVGWGKKGKRGEKKKWVPRILEFDL